jgi:hypothetical protein
VISEEDRFWAVNVANNINLEQVFFEQFHRMDVIGWFIDSEESSSHGYDNKPEDNENIDSKNVDEGPGDHCKESANADDNIDDERGSHDIPDKPPESPHTNPPPQPAEPETF